MRKFLAVLVAALSIGVMGVSPVQADHNVTLGHTNAYWWGGRVENPSCQAAWVFDRSGDTTVNAATQEFINAYNNDTYNRGLQCVVPYLAYVNDYSSIGQCFDGAYGFPGWSFITMCSRGGIDSQNGYSVAYSDCGGCHYSHLQANVLIQRGYPDYLTTYTHVAHELAHALMGLAHSGDVGSLMYPSVPVGRAKQLSEHDWVALRNKYVNHQGCCI